MLYSYALYSKKHNKSYFVSIFIVLLIAVAHVAILLDSENLWLLIGLIVYLPVYLIWSKISTIRSRLPD